ncbi:MAG: redoxin family protein [Terriglobia bacterium]
MFRSDQNQLIFEEGFSFSGYERDAVYLNLCNKKFLNISGVSGLDSISDGRAAVFADFDNDGDLDVFLTTIQGQVHLLFRNNVGQENHFLRIELEGDPEVGRDAYGAVVRVKTGAGTPAKIKSGGAGFLSQHDPRLLFGLHQNTQVEWIEVVWPDGMVERFNTSVRAGTSLRLHRGTGRIEEIALGRAQLPDPLTPVESLARSLKISVGEPMPDLPLKTLAGRPTSLGKRLRPGRRTLINLWATWCAPCAREMPELESLSREFSARGIDLMGINIDTEPRADIRGFLTRTGTHYPVYVGGIPAIERIFATDNLSVPLSLLLDEQGTVEELIPGWSGETRQRFLELAGIEATEPRKVVSDGLEKRP